VRSRAWTLYDRIVSQAAPDGVHSSPWRLDASGEAYFSPDLPTLRRLLGVPLFLEAKTTTGVPALALDVWFSYELRRAGFDPDAIWPRPDSPRVLPGPVRDLVKSLPPAQQVELWRRLRHKTPKGAAANSANILGKNYVKQVDVVLSGWHTGPELLISTKRMDSSFGNNAANRVEESYGDAKNLRLRHPLAALGFAYGLRSTIFQQSPPKAEWLIDLLQKLGREDDAYHAVTLLVLEYDTDVPETEEDAGDAEQPLAAAGLVEEDGDEEAIAEEVAADQIDVALAALPAVALREDLVPPALQPGPFLGRMVQLVLDTTPVTFHKEARTRLRNAP
jgi:hypothetical protein